MALPIARGEFVVEVFKYMFDMAEVPNPNIANDPLAILSMGCLN